MLFISDVTMKQTAENFALSFKEKIELAKLLDKLGLNVIELEGIRHLRTDSLLIKSIGAAVSESIVAVPVQLNSESVDQTWNALQAAKKPRLQVCAPVSSVQMEYLFHKKPEGMLSSIRETVAACAALCPTEFVADDATRSDPVFLQQTICAAIEAGASVVTVCDSAGIMLPSELTKFIQDLYAGVPTLKEVSLGISCANDLSLADACTISAIAEGVCEIKAAAYPINTASVANIAKVLSARTDTLSTGCAIKVTQLSRVIEQISWLCQPGKNKSLLAEGANDDQQDIYLTAHDDITAIAKAVEKMGYDLSEEDILRVYEAFQNIAQKKENVGIKELDAIVASAAMQVPSTYKLDTYLITSGNTISSTAHLKLIKNAAVLEGACIGSGPIDAAFLTIEQIIGCHYELDDFQIQSVTEGREAMGQAMVKLRHEGRVYSGRGISTDIVGASIQAYLSALNKIVYEGDDV